MMSDDVQSEAKDFIEKELESMSSNSFMNKIIIERLSNFISLLDADFSIDIEITSKNQAVVEELIPIIQELQTKFDDTIADIISERIILEMCLFKARTQNNI